jgi:hypothetical protein
MYLANAPKAKAGEFLIIRVIRHSAKNLLDFNTYNTRHSHTSTEIRTQISDWKLQQPLPSFDATVPGKILNRNHFYNATRKPIRTTV